MRRNRRKNKPDKNRVNDNQAAIKLNKQAEAGGKVFEDSKVEAVWVKVEVIKKLSEIRRT